MTRSLPKIVHYSNEEMRELLAIIKKDLGLRGGSRSHFYESMVNVFEQPARYMERPNYFGMTPLVCAIYYGSIELVEKLLDAGADPMNQSTENPLAVAADRPSPIIVRLLLQRGVQADTPETIQVLEKAVSYGRKNIVQILIEFNAPVHVKIQGETLLHRTARNDGYDALEIINMLYAAGADPLQLNQDGKTAFDLAEHHRIQEIPQRLTEIMAEYEADLLRLRAKVVPIAIARKARRF